MTGSTTNIIKQKKKLVKYLAKQRILIVLIGTSKIRLRIAICHRSGGGKHPGSNEQSPKEISAK
jgi:hypothetical protein